MRRGARRCVEKETRSPVAGDDPGGCPFHLIPAFGGANQPKAAGHHRSGRGSRGCEGLGNAAALGAGGFEAGLAVGAGNDPAHARGAPQRQKRAWLDYEKAVTRRQGGRALVHRSPAGLCGRQSSDVPVNIFGDLQGGMESDPRGEEASSLRGQKIRREAPSGMKGRMEQFTHSALCSGGRLRRRT